jgi:DNA mismatch repair protein MutL
VRLSGYAGLPTYSRGTATHQFLFVNGRPVKDRLLQGALRGAYADFLARDRHPLAALYLEVEPELVDVNVHPAKSEVRFRDPAMVRGLVVGALRHALAAEGRRASTTVAASALSGFRPGGGGSSWSGGYSGPSPTAVGLAYAVLPGFAEPSARVEAFDPNPQSPTPTTPSPPRSSTPRTSRSGRPRPGARDLRRRPDPRRDRHRRPARRS